jgi:hypothetical protein
VILRDNGRTRSIPALDRVGEPVLDPRVDLELRDPDRSEPPLDSGDERPYQTLPAVRGIDQDVE